jgi:hypothetical protein
MDFGNSEHQEAIRRAVRQLCKSFGGEYWRETDANADTPRSS